MDCLRFGIIFSKNIFRVVYTSNLFRVAFWNFQEIFITSGVMSVYTKSVTNSLKNIIVGVYVGIFVDFEISVSVKH